MVISVCANLQGDVLGKDVDDTLTAFVLITMQEAHTICIKDDGIRVSGIYTFSCPPITSLIPMFSMAMHIQITKALSSF